MKYSKPNLSFVVEQTERRNAICHALSDYPEEQDTINTKSLHCLPLNIMGNICKHNTDIHLNLKVDNANWLANSCLYAHPVGMGQN